MLCRSLFLWHVRRQRRRRLALHHEKGEQQEEGVEMLEAAEGWGDAGKRQHRLTAHRENPLSQSLLAGDVRSEGRGEGNV